MRVKEKRLHCKIDILTIYNLSIPFLTASAKKINEKILCYYILQTSNHQAVETSNDCSNRGQYVQSIQPIVQSLRFCTMPAKTITAKSYQLLYATPVIVTCSYKFLYIRGFFLWREDGRWTRRKSEKEKLYKTEGELYRVLNHFHAHQIFNSRFIFSHWTDF